MSTMRYCEDNGINTLTVTYDETFQTVGFEAETYDSVVCIEMPVDFAQMLGDFLRNLRAENDTQQPTPTDTGLQDQAETPENAEKP